MNLQFVQMHGYFVCMIDFFAVPSWWIAVVLWSRHFVFVLVKCFAFMMDLRDRGAT